MAPSVAIVTSRRRKAVVGAVVVLIIGAVAWAIIDRFRALDEEGPRARDERAVPIEVVTLATGSLTERRRFSGSLESPGRFVVAPKVGGRVEAVHVDLEDEVAKGQVVVELDDAARAHAVATAEAELKVARAQRAEAASAHSQAERELRRVQRLHGGGLASDAQLEAAEAAEQAQTARVASARAEIARAAAAVEAARVELADTQVTASWREGEAARVVGERRVNEGDTVAANTPLLVVVALDPLRAVIQLTEDSYGHISHDQTVTLTADAWPDERFTGRVARIAPMFQEGSRQARV